MKAVVLSATFCLLAAPSAHAQALVSKQERELDQILDQIWGPRTEAQAGAKVAVPHKTDNFIDTDDGGTRRTAAEIAVYDAANPGLELDKSIITRTDKKYFFYGKDVAIATYRGHDCLGAPGNEPCFHFAATDTFVRQGGRWLQAAGQQTAISSSAPDFIAISTKNVLDVQSALDQAQIKSNTSDFDTYTADNWLMPYGKAAAVTKQKFMQDMQTFWKPASIERTDVVVRVLRWSAIVTGRVESTWTDKDGQKKTALENFTDVYGKRFRSWRRVSSHVSCISGACS